MLMLRLFCVTLTYDEERNEVLPDSIAEDVCGRAPTLVKSTTPLQYHSLLPVAFRTLAKINIYSAD